MTAKTETLAQFARRLGVNRSTVTRAKQAGRLVMHESGRVMVEASLRTWHETKAGHAAMEALHAEKRGAAIPSVGEWEENATAAREMGLQGKSNSRNNPRNSDNNDVETETGGNRTGYKAMALKYENEAIKLEMALRRGTRFGLDDVKREALSIGGTLRASLERLIDQTAPRLAVMTDRDQREALLRSECASLRRSLRGEFVRAMRRLKRQSVSKA